jgi:hypothetical protein
VVPPNSTPTKTAHLHHTIYTFGTLTLRLFNIYLLILLMDAICEVEYVKQLILWWCRRAVLVWLSRAAPLKLLDRSLTPKFLALLESLLYRQLPPFHHFLLKLHPKWLSIRVIAGEYTESLQYQILRLLRLHARRILCLTLRVVCVSLLTRKLLPATCLVPSYSRYTM